MGIRIEEKGRAINVIVEDDPKDISFHVRPVNTHTGASLLGIMLDLSSGAFGTDISLIQRKTESIYKLAFGDAVVSETDEDGDPIEWSSEEYKKLDDLRNEEAMVVANIAFVWNAEGGSLDAAKELAKDFDYPKALGIVFERSGVGPLGRLMTSQSGASESPTSTDDTPDTNIPE